MAFHMMNEAGARFAPIAGRQAQRSALHLPWDGPAALLDDRLWPQAATRIDSDAGFGAAMPLSIISIALSMIASAGMRPVHRQ
jgi:hypothetical protein